MVRNRALSPPPLNRCATIDGSTGCTGQAGICRHSPHLVRIMCMNGCITIAGLVATLRGHMLALLLVHSIVWGVRACPVSYLGAQQTVPHCSLWLSGLVHQAGIDAVQNLCSACHALQQGSPTYLESGDYAILFRLSMHHSRRSPEAKLIDTLPAATKQARAWNTLAYSCEYLCIIVHSVVFCLLAPCWSQDINTKKYKYIPLNGCTYYL